jgi:homoserine kinase
VSTSHTGVVWYVPGKVDFLTSFDQSSQIPGLPEVTSSITPSTHPGLLGICLSGAGPTILALALTGFKAIAEDARKIFLEKGIEVDWLVLDVITEGSSVDKL